MLLETLSTGLTKIRPSANSTDSSYPSRIPTATEPTGDGVVNLGWGGAYSQNGIIVLPYAIASNNDTFAVRLIGWRLLGVIAQTGLWVPMVLCEVACTASAAVGVAGRQVLNTERFADTMTLTTGNAGVDVDMVSPTGDVIAHFVADLKGCQKVELTFSLAGGSATSMNALYALL